MNELFGKGRKQDVIVQLLPRTREIYNMYSGQAGSETYEFDRVMVWANANLLNEFKMTEGVMLVKKSEQFETCYILCIDPRYDTNWVIEEIKATAQLPTKEENVQPVQQELSWTEYIKSLIPSNALDAYNRPYRWVTGIDRENSPKSLYIDDLVDDDEDDDDIDPVSSDQ